MLDKTEQKLKDLKNHKNCAIAIIIAFILGALIF